MGGSTEIFRSNEFQVEQISFGGNFHWQNVQRPDPDHEWNVRRDDAPE